MIKFAHIAPTSCMDVAHLFSGCNMTLAHIVDQNDRYAEFYRKSSKFTIMDNGAFELKKPYTVDRLIELGHKVGADCIVAPDYPYENWKKTVDAFEAFYKKAKSEGFQVMFVPQSETNDIEGYVEAWRWAAKNSDVDLIGCSILGAPNADTTQDRLIMRYKILRLTEKFTPRKKVHMLGLLDSPYEIALCKQFRDKIYSWDSSAAVWAGLHGIDVRDIKRKFEKEVDFNHPLVNRDLVKFNIMSIQEML